MASLHSSSVEMIQVSVSEEREGREGSRYGVVVGLIDPWKRSVGRHERRGAA